MLLGEGDGWGLDSPTTSLPNFFIFTFLSLSGEGDGVAGSTPQSDLHPANLFQWHLLYSVTVTAVG
jgi:hypothetical protein